MKLFIGWRKPFFSSVFFGLKSVIIIAKNQTNY